MPKKACRRLSETEALEAAKRAIRANYGGPGTFGEGYSHGQNILAGEFRLLRFDHGKWVFLVDYREPAIGNRQSRAIVRVDDVTGRGRLSFPA